jgi:UDP-N-acetyl-D-galactosamine dehydrogenase
MGNYVVAQLVKSMTKRRIQVVGAKVLVMGLTFKENCPDLRNTRVIDIVTELNDYNCDVSVYDPWVAVEGALQEYGITPITQLEEGSYDAIILAVAHRHFKEMGYAAIRALAKPVSVLYDLKYVLAAQESDLRL